MQSETYSSAALHAKKKHEPIIIHIGLPKTATTLLQYHIFKPAYAERFFHWKFDPNVRILRQLAQTTDFTAQDTGQATSWLKKLYCDGLALISCENISSQARGFWDGSGPSPYSVASTLRRLQETADIPHGGVKIILGVRRQDHMLASRYAQFAAENKRFSQIDFESRVSELISAASPKPGHAWLYYDEVLRDWNEAFGPENVFLYSQEFLESSPDRFLIELGDFCTNNFFHSVDEDSALWNDKSINKKSISDNTWALGKHGEVLILNEDVQSIILNHFRTSNSRFVGEERYNLGATAGERLDLVRNASR